MHPIPGPRAFGTGPTLKVACSTSDEWNAQLGTPSMPDCCTSVAQTSRACAASPCACNVSGEQAHMRTDTLLLLSPERQAAKAKYSLHAACSAKALVVLAHLLHAKPTWVTG
jgi:hypothetical protein